MSDYDWKAADARFKTTLAGGTPERVPMVMLPMEDMASRISGLTVREIIANPQRHAEASIQSAEFLGMDFVLPMGFYGGPFEALAYLEVNDKVDLFRWHDYATPFIDTGKLCATADDVKNLKIPNHRQDGPWPVIFESLKIIKKEIGIRALAGGMLPSVTWSNVQMYRGAQAFVDAKRNPGLLLELCEKIYASHMDMYRSYCDIVGEEPDFLFNAGYAFNRTMLSFDDAWKFEGQFIARMAKETGKPLAWHNCGFDPYWRELVVKLQEASVQVIGVNGSFPLDLNEWVAFRDEFPEVPIIGASISVNHEIENGTPEDVEERVRQNIVALASKGRYVVCPICCPAWRHPFRNLLAVRSAVEKYGYFPIAES